MKQIKQIRELGLAINWTKQNCSCIIIYITHKDENGSENSPGLSEDGLFASEDVKKSICRFWNADFDFPWKHSAESIANADCKKKSEREAEEANKIDTL